MELTYTEALASIIETTEMGYTVASQDRLWTVFIFDLWSEDEMRYNRLYSLGLDNGWSYEMWENELVWTSRWEAEEFAIRMRERLADDAAHGAFDGGEVPEVYVINWGDDARYEAKIIGRGRVTCRTTPKFKGSERAWVAMTEMSVRWLEAGLA